MNTHTVFLFSQHYTNINISKSKKIKMKKILFAILMTMTLTNVFAQERRTTVSVVSRGATVDGRVLDSESGEPLVQCSVALMSSDTTKLITGVVSGQDGSFSIKGVKKGNYIVKISFVGYHNFYHKLDISEERGSHKLGTVLLASSSIVLNQAVVTGQLKEMEMKDDTLMFNADAFKVPEGSVLEDLIRKLPGVEMEEDGTIKVNGKTVKRILVDGKEFFNNDKKMTLENIPTHIINKIKTYEKQSDFSRITGIDDGNEETVMDLSLKKGTNKGWMGDINGAYGTRDRWAGRVNARRFKEGFSTFIFGNMGNSTGRNASNGDNTNGSMGANMVFAVKNFEIGGSVNYRGSNSKSTSKTASQSYVATAAFSNSLNSNRNTNNSFNGQFKMEWKIDSLTTVVFSPSFVNGNNHSNRSGQSISFKADPYSGDVNDPLSQRYLIADSIKLNENESSSWNEGKNYNYSGNLMFNRRLGGKPWFGPGAEKGTSGRNFSVTLRGTTSENNTFNTQYTHLRYNQKDSTDITYRHTKTPTGNRDYSLGFSYSEPILRNLFAQLNYRYSYSKRYSDGDTYDFGLIDAIGEQIWNQYGQFGLDVPEEDLDKYRSDLYSRFTDNVNKTHNVDFNLRFITQILNLSAGVSTELQKQRMAYCYNALDTVATRSISRVSPNMNARFRFTRQHSLNLTYRGNSSQPNITDLFNNRDESNPMRIREGNPDLKPSFTNNFNVDYQRQWIESRQSVNARFAYSTTKNSITNCTEYNEETGGTVSHPENVDGHWNISGNVGFNTPLFTKKITFNTSTNASYNNNVSFLYKDKITTLNTVTNTNLSERVTFTLRLADIDVRANGSINWTRAKNALVESANRDTYNFRYGLSSTGNFSNGFGYSTDIEMNSRRGYATKEANTNELIWNAEISYRFLKRRATLSLQAFDILQQRSNVSRQISTNGRSDSENKFISSYYMLRFAYRLNKIGGRRQQQPDTNAGERSGQREYQREDRGERGSGGGARFRVVGR